MSINWIIKKFGELNPSELYSIMRLRNEVFVVEQGCLYLDADDKDQPSRHLMGWDAGQLIAYARLIPPGISYEECSIGRVVTAPGYRKMGIGTELMKQSTNRAFNLFNSDSIKIGAQLYLKEFYTSLGFIQCSGEYLEDGIPHIGMILHK